MVLRTTANHENSLNATAESKRVMAIF